MTSNFGATYIAEHIEQGNFEETKPTLKRQIIQMMKQRISSEFVNRIDEIVLFNPLSGTVIRKIILLQLTKLKNKLIGNGIEIAFEDDVVNYLAEVGFEPEMGARPVKRAIDRYIVDPLAQNLLASIVNKDSKIIISCVNNEIKFSN